MYSLTPTLKNNGKTEKIYIKQGWSQIKFNVMDYIFYFLNLSIDYEKYVLHLDKWTFGLIGWVFCA